MTHAAVEGNQDDPIKLIELSIAGADAAPIEGGAAGGENADIETYTNRGPKAGYWYRTLRFADESEDDLDRFAACATPDAYGSSGTVTFIISHHNTLFRKDLGEGGVPEVFPENPAAEGWEKMD